MFGLFVKTKPKMSAVKRAMARVSYKAIKEATFDIRVLAMASIKAKPSAKGQAWRAKRGGSKPGSPPHTRARRRQLPKSIWYHADRDGLGGVVGPVFSRMKTVGAVHEFGGQYMGQDYPARPFMGPALQKVAPKLPWYWQNTLTT